MKNRLYILFTILWCFALKQYAQDTTTVACTGSWVRYAYAPGDTLGNSYFEWFIKGDYINKRIHPTGDTIDIHWGYTSQSDSLGACEISNLGCSSDTFWTVIKVTNGMIVDLGPDQDHCVGEPYQFDAGSNFTSYNWNNNDTTQTISGIATKTDTFSVKVRDKFGCQDVDTAILIVHPLPNISILVNDAAGIDSVVLCGNDQYHLQAITGENDSLYNWSNHDIGQDIYISTFPGNSKIDSMNLYVTVTSDYNCKSTDSIKLINCQLPTNDGIPHAFIPNSSNWKNKTWNLEFSSLVYFKNVIVDVYDRWGRLVFHTDNGSSVFWDGKYNGSPLPMDNYFYIIKVNSSLTLHGNVAILR